MLQDAPKDLGFRLMLLVLVRGRLCRAREPEFGISKDGVNTRARPTTRNNGARQRSMVGSLVKARVFPLTTCT